MYMFALLASILDGKYECYSSNVTPLYLYFFPTQRKILTLSLLDFKNEI